MSTIRIEKNNFLVLKFACCTNSLKLCPLVVETLLFDRKVVTLQSQILLRILKVSIISPLISVKDNTQVYFLGATKNWCTASIRSLFLR